MRLLDGSNSEWGSIETTNIGNTHPALLFSQSFGDINAEIGRQQISSSTSGLFWTHRTLILEHLDDISFERNFCIKRPFINHLKFKVSRDLTKISHLNMSKQIDISSVNDKWLTLINFDDIFMKFWQNFRFFQLMKLWKSNFENK